MKLLALLLSIFLSVVSLAQIGEQGDDDVSALEAQRKSYAAQIGATDGAQKQNGEENLEKSLQQTVQDLQSMQAGLPTMGGDGAGQKADLSNFDIKSNPFAGIPENQLMDMVDNHPHPLVKALAQKFPKAKVGVVKVLKDDNAVLKLFSLLKKKDKLKNYGIIMLVINILLFIFSFFKKKNANIFKRFFRKIFTFAFAFSSGILIFYFYFQEEIGPAWSIFWNTIST